MGSIRNFIVSWGIGTLLASIGLILFEGGLGSYSALRLPSPWLVPETASTKRPRLTDLVASNGTIISDVDWLLDFAIVAHAKCATSKLMRLLSALDDVQMPPNELHALRFNRPHDLVKIMYELPEGNFKRGYKAPNDLTWLDSVVALRKFWPRAKLVVGIRHPVKLLESFINYIVRKGHEEKALRILNSTRSLPAEILMHVNMAKLGKTEMDLEESLLLSVMGQPAVKHPYMPNKVFVYDVSQLFVDQANLKRNTIFREDLRRYLDLREAPKEEKPRKTSKNYHYKIDICEEQHSQLRSRTMDVSRVASMWLRKYFLPHPDVMVSCPDHINEILLTWLEDPCMST